MFFLTFKNSFCLLQKLIQSLSFSYIFMLILMIFCRNFANMFREWSTSRRFANVFAELSFAKNLIFPNPTQFVNESLFNSFHSFICFLTQHSDPELARTCCSRGAKIGQGGVGRGPQGGQGEEQATAGGERRLGSK